MSNEDLRRFLRQPAKLRLAAAGPSDARPAPRDRSYFFLEGGVVRGPVSAESARYAYAHGGHLPTDLAWASGDEIWKSMREHFPGVRPDARLAAGDILEACPSALGAVLGPSEWLWDALGYPFRGWGLVRPALTLALVSSMLAFGLQRLLGPISFLCAAASLGIPLAPCLQRVIWDTVAGRNRAPEFGETILGDPAGQVNLEPAMNWAAATLAWMGPGLAMLAWAARREIPALEAISVAVLACGLLCWPMALLLVALEDSLSGMSPLRVWAAIRATRRSYPALVLVWGGGIAALVADAASEGDRSAFWGGIHFAMDGAYFTVVGARAMGLFFREHAAALEA